MNLPQLHKLIQEIIDAIGSQQKLVAKSNIVKAQELINLLTDNATTNENLVELSKYQTLITMLNNKLK